MNTKDNTHLVEYTGDSFRDLTRIAKINENLWSEVFFLNKENLIREIDDFIQEVNHLKATLEPVSYTHLDVYKRQLLYRLNSVISNSGIMFSLHFHKLKLFS